MVSDYPWFGLSGLCGSFSVVVGWEKESRRVGKRWKTEEMSLRPLLSSAVSHA